MLSDGERLVTLELVVVWEVLACVEALTLSDAVGVICRDNTLLLADPEFVTLVGTEELLLVDNVAV